ncbi:MAG: aspartate aminotransferase family protein [Nitrososphaerales archaeon]
MESGYEARTARSRAMFDRARRIFAGGVNHNARFYEPYPIFVSKAKGRHIWDLDGNRYTDYWMGHMALLLGHSPSVVTGALRRQVARGTHYGMGSRLAVELGEEVQRSVPCSEMLRFCNTGAEATMYLVRLARGYTGRKTVIKMAGGWHGYNTELNKGVHTPFDRVEGAGILDEEQAHIRTVRFNDLDAAKKAVDTLKDDVAAIFLEPVLGAGGCIPADKDYLKGLREIADESGALLAFDEIITGFRVALGGAQKLYDVTPDLASFGKIVGGGLPIGLVCGRKEILSLADPSKKQRFVSIGGGTFSENPLTMTAGLSTIRYLRKNAETIYPRLDRMGRELRAGVDSAFAQSGVEAHTTGLGSLFLTHFGISPRNAEEALRERGDLTRRYALFLMSKGIFLLPSHGGGISACHTEDDIVRMVQKSGEFGALISSRTEK